MICKQCQTPMVEGKALKQILIGGTPDFIGDNHSSTFNLRGADELIDCMKCPACGWSVTKEQNQ